METKSLVEWAKYVAVALPLIGASGTVIIYAEELKNSIGDIRKEQTEIRKAQNTIIGDMDRRFDKVEDGHDRIVSEATDGLQTLSLEVGRLSGQQEERARWQHSSGRTEHER